MHKMLIVDDNEGNLNVLKMSFRDDYRVVFSSNGDKALEELFKPENNDITIIISDKKMPGISGVQFLKASKERFPHAIRVLITNYPDHNDLEVLINDIGVNLFYSTNKDPIAEKMEELKNRLEKAVAEYEVNRVKDYLYDEWLEKQNKKSH